MPARSRAVSAPSEPNRPKNKLLARLPDADFERLRPSFKTIPITTKQVLHRAHEPVREVFFPNGGVVSLTTMTEDGSMVEIATIGDEGVTGVLALLGDGVSPTSAMVQIPDTSAEVMASDAFRQELARGGAFADAMTRYTQGVLALMVQSTTCIALHSVQERACRWLLMAHDRVHRDEFRLSHEFLAMMLASTRPTVTVVARTLQHAGLLTYVHGRIKILDRQGLEDASCECYRVVRRQFDRLGL